MLSLKHLFESINYTVKQSPVHGKGIFSNTYLSPNVNLGTAMYLKNKKQPWIDKNVIRTDLGKYVNHSKFPNIKMIKEDNIINYITIKDIQRNEELFIDYNNFDFDGDIPD